MFGCVPGVHFHECQSSISQITMIRGLQHSFQSEGAPRRERHEMQRTDWHTFDAEARIDVSLSLSLSHFLPGPR